MSITHQPDHAGVAQGRLIEILKKPRMKALVGALATEVQALEDVAYDLLTKRLLNATGVQLDILGKIVGQRRGGDDDTLYLAKIKGRIRANKSRGTTEDIIAVLRAVLGTGGRIMTGDIVSPEVGTPELVMHLDGLEVDAALGEALTAFLTDSKASGVRGILEWQRYGRDRGFRFASCGFTTGPLSIGATVIPYTRRTSAFTKAWPTTGFVTIGAGTDAEGPKAYTGNTGTQITLTVALAKNHVSGDVVSRLRTDEVTGDHQGWGDYSGFDPNIGGAFASARQA